MSEDTDMTIHDPAEAERLGRLLARAARTRPGMIANALSTWESANPERLLKTVLGCGDEALWRLAVTPRPFGDGMVAQAQRIAAELGVDVLGLLNVLRFAETTARFSAANDDGEMLMAALDADRAEADLRDGGGED